MTTAMTHLVGNGGKSRIFAMVIDNLVAILLALAIASSVSGLGDVSRGVVLIAIYLLYYLLLEAVFARTIGKFVCGLIVCQYDGRACDWKAAAVRTLLRIIEVNPLLAGALPGGLVITFSKRKQRIGDMLAKTVVISLNDRRLDV